MEGSQHYQDLPYVQHEPWMDRSGYNPQHHSPMEEYSPYGFASSPPLQPGFATPHPQRPALQPIITAPWPSMVVSQQQHQQQHQQHNVYNQPPAPIHSVPPPAQPPPPQSLQTSPQSATTPQQLGSSQSGHTSSQPRRTLTDNDRRKMCEYHEAHPTKKQTEIGEIFGVERSTVSKVLRQKEKYLRQDEGSRSPVKASKKNKPDLDRALAKWAANQQQKGVRVTDDDIQKQARLFWHAAGNTTDPPVKIDSPNWLEKFKQKNNVSSAAGTPSSSSKRRSPLVGGSNDDGDNISPISHDPITASTDTPLSPDDTILSRNVSPTSATETHPPHSSQLRRQPSSSYEGLGIRNASAASMRAPLHSQSNTSLSSAFTEATGPTAFSSENTSVGSPVISPDVISPPSSYFPASTQSQTLVTPVSAVAPPLHTPRNPNEVPRPRSQTFPTLGTNVDAYISPPQSANTSSPLHTSTVAVFDSPVTEMPPPPAPKGPHGHSPLSPHHVSHPGLSKTKSTPHLGTTTRHAVAGPPSLGEAKKGLEAAVAYLKSRGVGNDDRDVAVLRGVMHKIVLNDVAGQRGESGTGGSGGLAGGIHSGAGLPGGLHRIPEQEFGREGDDDDDDADEQGADAMMVE